MSIYPTSLVTTVILAGGQSSRMGQDKALLTWQGVPMLQRVVRVAAQCSEQIYCITPWPERYQSIAGSACEWITESEPGQGPLVAFSQAFEWVSSPWILLLGCDLPQLDVAILHQWMGQLPEVPDSILAVVPRQGDRWEPLCAFYRSPIQSSLNQFLDRGGRSFQQWLPLLPVQPLSVDTSVDRMLYNCNTPEDLQP